MTQKELIRQEIERRIGSVNEKQDANPAMPKYRWNMYEGMKEAFIDMKFFIDSLQQEQPEVDLKKEIKEWTDLMVGASFPEQDGDFISEEDYRSVIRQTAIHFLSLNAKEDKQ